jgi:hypothetical protein
VPGGLTEARGQRPGRNDRPNSRQDERDGGEEISRKLPQPARGARIFDLDPRSAVNVLGECRLFVVVAADDRKVLAGNARGVQFARCGGRSGGGGKKCDNEWM